MALLTHLANKTLDSLHLNVKANFKLIPVKIGDKWTYIGKDGKRLDIDSEDLGPFTEKGYAIVGRGVANDCVINMKGNIVYSLSGCYLQWLNEDYLLFYPKNAKGNCGITEKHGLIRITMKSPSLAVGESYWNAIYKIEDRRLVQLVPGGKWLSYVGEDIYARNSQGKYDSFSLNGTLIREDDCDDVLY